MSGLQKIISLVDKGICNAVNRAEYEAQTFVAVNERPVEYRFVFDNLAELCPREVLDVGTGKTALPSLMRHCGFVVTAVDNMKDFWPEGAYNRHYHVQNLNITRSGPPRNFDFITCISVLEHIEDNGDAVKSMAACLNPGGRLVMTFPYTDDRYCGNVYEMPGSNAFGLQLPYKTRSFSRVQVKEWCGRNKLVIEKQEYWRFYEGPYWSVGKRTVPPQRVRREELHQLTCLLLCKQSP